MQIEYEKPDGMRCLRVVTAVRTATEDRDHTEEGVDVANFAVYATQHSGIAFLSPFPR